jgi:hypothetical protein
VTTADFAPTAAGQQLGVAAAARRVGSLCNAFSGYWVAGERCVSVTGEGPLGVLNGAAVVRWLTDNWWIVLAIEAGLVCLAFLVRCTTSTASHAEFYARARR